MCEVRHVTFGDAEVDCLHPLSRDWASPDPLPMRRTLLPLFALVAAQRGGTAAPDAAGPDEQHTFLDRALDEVASGIEALHDYLASADPIEAMVRAQVGLRDLVRTTEDWMVSWAGAVAPQAPDLTALRASPVPEVESSGFGWRDDPVRGRHRRFHKGTDFRAERGTPVHAAGDGVVAFTGWQHGYGRVIYVDHGGGVITRYAHLAKIEVDAGAMVVASARIGQVGASGRATGPHLHFEVRLDGRAVDPVLAMKVAELERTQPDLAAVLATALSPDIQDHSLDEQDPTNRRRTRDDRHRPSGRRSQALW